VKLPHPFRLALLCLSCLLGVAACGGGGAAPDLPADADDELRLGEEVYAKNCSNCHGADGSGGLGKTLNDGAVIATYPDAADQAAFVEVGASSMPAFGERLSPDEIDAVVRYTREVLNG